jgi:hypothetical protein
MIFFFMYTVRKNKVYIVGFFMIGVSFPNNMDLLHVGTNIFVRNKKK